MQMQEWIRTMILMVIAGISIPRVLLSSPDEVLDEDTFLRHSFLVAGFILIAFASDPSNSL